jgi:phage-related protein
VGTSKDDLLKLPVDVRKFFGHALDFAQRGARHAAAKPLRGFGGAGVLEVFVLHCFQKKSKTGIATPRKDMDIIRARLKVAERLARGQPHDKADD